MTPIDLLSRYDEIVLHDFEFVPGHGEHPDVVCLACRIGFAWVAPLGGLINPVALISSEITSN